MDTENAYQGSKLDIQIYREVSEGVEALTGSVLLIQKSVNGLQKSAYFRNACMKGILKEIEFEPIIADCLGPILD
jgi:hypothetical protein